MFVYSTSKRAKKKTVVGESFFQCTPASVSQRERERGREGGREGEREKGREGGRGREREREKNISGVGDGWTIVRKKGVTESGGRGRGGRGVSGVGEKVEGGGERGRRREFRCEVRAKVCVQNLRGIIAW